MRVERGAVPTRPARRPRPPVAGLQFRRAAQCPSQTRLPRLHKPAQEGGGGRGRGGAADAEHVAARLVACLVPQPGSHQQVGRHRQISLSALLPGTPPPPAAHSLLAGHRTLQSLLSIVVVAIILVVIILTVVVVVRHQTDNIEGGQQEREEAEGVESACRDRVLAAARLAAREEHSFLAGRLHPLVPLLSALAARSFTVTQLGCCVTALPAPSPVHSPRVRVAELVKGLKSLCFVHLGKTF